MNTEKWDIPQRFVKITFYQGRKYSQLREVRVLSTIDRNFKFSFSTAQANTGALQELNLTISGLHPETMYFLATSTSAWVKDLMLNTLTLEAGYDDNYSLLFEGEIINAVPDLDSANYSIQIKATSYFSSITNKAFTLNAKGRVPLSNLLRQVAGRLRFSFINNLDGDEFITDYSAGNCSPFQHIRELARISNRKIWVEKQRLIASKVNKPLKFPPVKITDEQLIGVPQPNKVGANIKIRMNTSIMSGQAVKLISKRFPQLNSDEYVTQRISHAGDTYGANWLTNVELLRQDVFTSEELRL